MTRSTWAIPIDHGWAWVVVVGAFMNLLLLIGISKCFGILFAELMDIYHGSASETSTMLALSAGLSLFLAPVVTTLSDLYTCRIVSMVGGFICCLGFLVPAYCTSLEQVILSFGILTGLGYCVCLTPSAIIVGRYFERHRSLANGLMFSGSGVGGMVIPLFLNHIIYLFGLHGALVILAGLAFQTITFSALYRPAESWARERRQVVEAEQGDEQIQVQLDENGLRVTEPTTPVPPSDHNAINRRRVSSSAVLHRLDNPNIRPHASVSHLADGATLNVPSPRLYSRGLSGSLYVSAMNMAPWLPPAEFRPAMISYCDHAVQTDPVDQIREEFTSRPNIFQRCWNSLSRRVCRVKSDNGSDLPLVDLRLLRNVRFVLFIVGCMFILTSAYISMIIPPHCMEMGMSKTEVALLLSIQGGADTVGRLLIGFIGDRSFVKSRRELLVAICCLICAVSTLISVFLTTFWSLAAYLAICSVAVGAFVASIPVVLVDLVGIENLSRAWGLTAFLEGFSVTLSPLIIGALRDWTLSYISGLIFIDSCFALAAVCILVVVLKSPSGSVLLDTPIDTS